MLKKDLNAVVDTPSERLRIGVVSQEGEYMPAHEAIDVTPLAEPIASYENDGVTCMIVDRFDILNTNITIEWLTVEQCQKLLDVRWLSLLSKLIINLIK